MKIFLAGATGALGKRLLPLLVSDGHQVIGMTRDPAKADSLRAAGAEPAVADALDVKAVRNAVVPAQPDVVIHEMTSLATMQNPKNFDAEFAVTNRLRTEGTEHLLAAAVESGASRFVVQSFTGWPNQRTGGRVKTEADPLDPEPPRAMRRSLDAIHKLEVMVANATRLTGIVLRYGSFYGPGTSLGSDGEVVEMVRRRRFPIFGDGGGVWSFVHIDDAACATRFAIELGPAGRYNIVDDDPAEVSVWLPALAKAVGAKPPLHLPAWLGRLVIGEAGVSMMTRIRGSSNAAAKCLLGWSPRYASWREGFRSGLSESRAMRI
jgi:nucleoside-diphosphate-sugar epimerase